MNPGKFITNYSPVETYEAAAHKPSNKKPTSSSYVSNCCSSTCAANRQRGSSITKAPDFGSFVINECSKYKQEWRSLAADADRVHQQLREKQLKLYHVQ